MVAENERSALSVQSLEAPQSGVSKGYDFIDVNDTLATFATGLERFDRQAMRMAGVLLEDEKEPELAYPQSFDTRDFAQRLDFVKGLKDAGFPSALGRKEAYKTLTPEISTDQKVQAEINKEIDDAPMADPLEEIKKLDAKDVNDRLNRGFPKEPAATQDA